jgi:hypothetical protein
MRLKPGRLTESGARPGDVEDVLNAERHTIQQPFLRRLCLDMVDPAERSQPRGHWLTVCHVPFSSLARRRLEIVSQCRLQLPVADDGAGGLQESQVGAGTVFVTGAEPFEAVQPGWPATVAADRRDGLH